MNQFFQVIMSDDSNPDRFLIFFMTLAGCSLVSIPITWFVSDSKKEELTTTGVFELSMATPAATE